MACRLSSDGTCISQLLGSSAPLLHMSLLEGHSAPCYWTCDRFGCRLDAVVYADVLQLSIFLMGGSAAAVLTLHKIGGIPGTVFRSSCLMVCECSNHTGLYRESAEFHLEDGKYMHTWRDADSKHYSGPGLVFGLPFFIFWYWAVDQEMVQRALGAQTLGHARAGTIMAGFLKLFTPFLTVIPGMCARIFFEKCQRGPSC